jgi:adenylate cyclase
VDKFIGDAIMAYWNAPTEVADHADRAVSAALAQLRQLHQVNQALQAKYGVRIDIGMGINSGVATVGEMGSEGRSDYTVIGDSVNLASRLEGLNKLYGSHLIISDSTRARLRGDYLLRELDLVRVKGKQEPVRIHEVLGFAADGTLPGAPLTDYLEALSLYRQADFTAAGEAFAELVGHDPQPLYRLYLERCRHYRQDPPENFDGVFVPTSK